MFEDVVQIKMN